MRVKKLSSFHSKIKIVRAWPTNWDPVGLSAIQASRVAAQERGHRAILLVCGTHEDCLAAVKPLVTDPRDQIVWVGSPAQSDLQDIFADSAIPAPIPISHGRQVLGSECDQVIFDAFSGFDAESFAAVSGIVRGGGRLILLAPELQAWSAWQDPASTKILSYPDLTVPSPSLYLMRLAKLTRQSNAVSIASYCTISNRFRAEHQCVLKQSNKRFSSPMHATFNADGCTEDQRNAVQLIQAVAKGRTGRPLVMTADRGRGKTAALGLAAFKLLSERKGFRIAVAAARASSVAVLFSTFDQCDIFQVFEHTSSTSRSRDTGSTLKFYAPDVLVLNPPDCDLLFIDEAASLPTTVLTRMMTCCGRVILASTIHGYEGHGRGFAISFRTWLSEHYNQHRALHLSEPVRWRERDPLEAYVNRIFLLAAEPVTHDLKRSDINATQPGLSIQQVDLAALVLDESKLVQLYGLLVQAHYQTSPNDLRMILENQRIRLCTASFREQVIGVILAIQEGGLEDADLARSIWLGRRRPQGHLVPQSLSAHSGIKDAVFLNSLRIVRVAVAPMYQRSGIGARLVNFVCHEAKKNGLDFVSTSYSASPELFQFWTRCHFSTLRVGLTRDASSGLHSFMMAFALTEPGRRLLVDCENIQLMQLPDQLKGSLKQLEPGLVEPLWLVLLTIEVQRRVRADLLDIERADIEAYTEGNRPLNTVENSLARWAWSADFPHSNWYKTTPGLRVLFIQRILLGQTEQEIINANGLSGKKELASSVRRILTQLKSPK
ncbi:elongator methionine tRNA (ac4C34) acetyltransferase [Oleiphilus messinensis]|uniref:tRNA(Met) cytidine acetyltransferase TmcA n=1 Tax=Oleiphilus messinensis TaxID=141451 RepID=A0A1Y0I921_9GAMM|nr:GNAT family N-acetyltransferase [Oleiphilus messinensis]ARU56679.1 elongator methionine tRNA (ac4C34) acetyltransferase [Oleiphilus messinensis]